MTSELENPYASFYGYNGEEYNPLTGLQYLRARYYAPGEGRFFSADSYLGDTEDILSQNRYTYTYNNPINFSDPSGHVPQKDAAPRGSSGGLTQQSGRGGGNKGGTVKPPKPDPKPPSTSPKNPSGNTPGDKLGGKTPNIPTPDTKGGSGNTIPLSLEQRMELARENYKRGACEGRKKAKTQSTTGKLMLDQFLYNSHVGLLGIGASDLANLGKNFADWWNNTAKPGISNYFNNTISNALDSYLKNMTPSQASFLFTLSSGLERASAGDPYWQKLINDNYIQNSGYQPTGPIFHQGNNPSPGTLPIGYGNVSDNGCGAVAIYNAGELTGNQFNFADIIEYLERNGGLNLGGGLGVNPLAVGSYLSANGVASNTTLMPTSVDAAIQNSSASILCYYYNGANGMGAHYIAVEYKNGQSYMYNNDNKTTTQIEPSVDSYLRSQNLKAWSLVTIL